LAELFSQRPDIRLASALLNDPGMAPALENHALRYVDAQMVDTPAGRLTDATVVSPSGAKLGHLDGIVIDPLHRHASFLVVSVRKWMRTHRYLLPLEPSRIDSGAHELYVDVESSDLNQFPEVPAARIPAFSDEDLVDVFFAPLPS
jgi:PRC-barrel domain